MSIYKIPDGYRLQSMCEYETMMSIFDGCRQLEQRLAAAEAMNKKLLDERIIDRNLYYERGCEQGKLYIQEMLKEALGI